jgi:hypothetical protein
MQTNMGALDRLIRFIIGVVLAILVIANAVKGTAAIVIGIIAIAMLLTSILGFCGLYVPLKISTIKRKAQGQ